MSDTTVEFIMFLALPMCTLAAGYLWGFYAGVKRMSTSALTKDDLKELDAAVDALADKFKDARKN